MNWQAITEFNFTYAIPGGAWLKDASGNCDWCSFTLIDRQMGVYWRLRQQEKQGWMTGCWIQVVS